MMCFLAFGLSTGEALMSIPSIGLAANWLLEGKFKNKWKNFKSRHFSHLFFLLIYGVFIIGLLYTSHKGIAIKDLILKLPLFSLPLVLGGSDMLSKKEWQAIMGAFILGLIVSCSAGYWKYFNLDFTDYRDLSVFISHIRLSLLIGIGVLILLLYLKNEPSKNRFFLLIPLAYIIYFIRILESGTGYISLALALFIFILYAIVQLRKKIYLRLFMLAVAACFILASAGIYLAHQSITAVQDPLDKNNLEQFTARGNEYIHHRESEVLENGYYVWLYICPSEAKEAWNNRSLLHFDSTDAKGQKVYGTLYRYLTSKGIRKDFDGVMQLSDADVLNIENGLVTSVPRKYGVTARVKEVLYSLITYKENVDPNGHSLIQRIYYLEAGWNLVLQNPFFGVSKGNEMDAYHKYYRENDSMLIEKNQLRAHNQILSFFVCFGLIGGTIMILGIIIPFMKEPKHLLVLALAGFVILGFLTDDLLDTQAGVTFFAFFYCFFLFQTTSLHYQRSTSS